MRNWTPIQRKTEIQIALSSRPLTDEKRNRKQNAEHKIENLEHKKVYNSLDPIRFHAQIRSKFESERRMHVKFN